jgi:hypothetical protein
LPYVECDAQSPLGDPVRCENARVRRFPTWIIGGARFEGVMTLDEIARAASFAADAGGTKP